jgi:hypothetical protein
MEYYESTNRGTQTDESFPNQQVSKAAEGKKAASSWRMPVEPTPHSKATQTQVRVPKSIILPMTDERPQDEKPAASREDWIAAQERYQNAEPEDFEQRRQREKEWAEQDRKEADEAFEEERKGRRHLKKGKAIHAPP